MLIALLPAAGKVAVFGVDGQQRMDWKALHDRVWDMDWAHADRCVTASNDKTCKVWNPQTGEPARVAAAALWHCEMLHKCQSKELEEVGV
jgi:WD40 repeat protein